MDARRPNRIAGNAVRLALACTTLTLLVACDQSGKVASPPGMSELAWARVALERNPNIEVVATDVPAGVFTVRDKRTGMVQAVKLSELAAAPISQLTSPVSRSSAPSVSGHATAEHMTDSQPHGESSEPDSAPPPPPPEPAPAARPPIQSVAQEPVVAGKNYTVERTDGQVKVSGPGVSIVSSATGTASEAPGGDPALRKADPIICEGARMIHLDNRKIYVEGDGVTVRAGCELYLTNSRIVASGTGVIVQDATVHITNSYIEGGLGSVEAAMGAKLYVRDSTFSGLSRRDAFAQVQDQGGNEWR
ncbi:MAG TPA: hypothetical protein VH542_07925 [Steroidobacteraceae bacterium]|jgi:hypothetical protein